MVKTKIKQFIKKQNLIREGEQVLVAYSGGPDSTALLMSLHRLYPGVAAVYVNHQLRGLESKEEEEFVRRFCERTKIPLYVERIQWRNRPSNLEEAARTRRYRHLAKVAREHGFHKVALAHHRDDNVETFLLHLIRGAGPKGLAGLRPLRGIYIRPMLDCNRKEILSYLKENGIQFFTDTSNQNLEFRRNRIRNRLIPSIERDFNPAFSAAVHRTALWIAEQNQLMLKLMQPYKSLVKQVKGSWQMNRLEWLELDADLQKAILKMVLPEISPDLRLNSRSLQSILTSIQTGGIMELPGFLKIQCSKNKVRFVRKNHRIGPSEVDVPSAGTYPFPAANVALHFSVSTRNDYSPASDVAYLDADRASFPLYIRNWKKGDSFRPLGMKGHKKLSDFLIDKKVPRDSRKLIPLVYKDDDLIWMAGYQIHHDYRITDSTKRLLRIEMKKDA